MSTAAFARAETGNPVAALRRHVADLTREIDGLRTALDTKLGTLEAALKNPAHDGSLETLVMDLARVATAEAEATAARACLQAKLAGEELVQTVRADAERAVQTERAATAASHAELNERQTALNAASSRAETLQGEIEELRTALDGERKTSATLRQNVADAGDRISVIERAMETQVSAIRHELDDAHTEAKRELQETEAAWQEALTRADELTRERDALTAQLQSSHDAADQRLRVLETAQQHLETAARQLSESDNARQEALARVDATLRERDALAGERAEIERVLHETEACLQAATRDRDAVKTALEAANQASNAAVDAANQASKAAVDAAHHASKSAVEDARRAAQQDLDEAHKKAAAELETARKTARDEIDALKKAAESDVHAARSAVQSDIEAAHQATIADLEGAHLATMAELEAARALIAEIEKQRDQAVFLASQAAAEAAAQASARAVSDAAAQAAARAAAEAAAHAAAHAGVPAAAAVPAMEPLGDGRLYPDQPFRRASRHALPDHVQVEVDGGPAVLVDLSTTGAQLLSPTALKPNRPVKLMLPVNGTPVLCKGKVVWARLEPATKARPLAYRAGVAFSTVDESAIDTFLRNTGH